MPRTDTLRLLREQKIVIPENLTFEDLKLQMVENGAVKFDFDALRRIWIETGYHPDLLSTASAAEIFTFIVRVFSAYINAGGHVDSNAASIVGMLRDDTIPIRLLVPN